MCYKLHASRLKAFQRSRPCGLTSAPGADIDDDDDDDEDNAESDHDDLEEALVAAADHNYARKSHREQSGRASSGFHRRVYRLLYAVSVAGERKAVLNTLPRAVAVLSNSKRLFLSHLNVMFRCLHPGKAELCYIDTDSCIWSLSEDRLEDCLRADRLREWAEASIIADEAAQQSCHGLMKLEGSYTAGLFKNLKIYRLYNSPLQGGGSETPLTRCKGISRRTGMKLPDQIFRFDHRVRTVVHKTALRPSKAGEIWMRHEAKSLAMPFNLKRRVTKDGLHTRGFTANDSSSSSSSSSSEDLQEALA